MRRHSWFKDIKRKRLIKMSANVMSNLVYELHMNGSTVRGYCKCMAQSNLVKDIVQYMPLICQTLSLSNTFLSNCIFANCITVNYDVTTCTTVNYVTANIIIPTMSWVTTTMSLSS